MKLPISKRLLCCAELVPPCGTVADVGTDHGYLGIYLLQSGKCTHVIAADLREKPLASARTNARLFGIPIAFPLGGHNSPGDCCGFYRQCGSCAGATGILPRWCPSAHTGADEGRSDKEECPHGSMEFVLSDGLHNIKPGSFDTLVLAGMGGDLIANILAEAPWLEGGAYMLILQPQSAANDLRRFLGERGWAIERERLVRDGRFLYAVMAVRPGQGAPLSPGEQYISPALRREGDPLFPAYLARVRRALELTVQGITQSSDPADLARVAYYQAALEEIVGLRDQ
ncbi:MAG: SAM-dependent methyltransferase [Oscillospiraceae bacterium]|nr:SAM-dependent methyltransferase [Oscillospiraceae bacterium]